MTATDWRTHATEANERRFGDACTRLDDGLNDLSTPEGRAQESADERFTDWYDQAVNAASYDEFERRCEQAEFDAHFPEFPNRTFITWTDRDQVQHGAYRDDQTPDGGDWWVLGKCQVTSWRRLVTDAGFEMADLTVLVPAGDLPPAHGTAEPKVLNELHAEGCTVLPAPMAPPVFEPFWPEVSS